MNKNLLLTFVIFISLQTVFSQETFNAMFYNLLNFPLQTVPANRIDHLSVVLNDFKPDIFMVCELNNETGANSIINSMQQGINANYEKATFVLNTSDDTGTNQNDLQNLLFYNTEKFSLVSQGVITTLYRDFNHYKLKLNTIDQAVNPIYLEVFICHLKSSSGTVNQDYRLQMVEDFDAYLNTLPAESYVILGGDLNLYSSSEPAFQKLIDTNNHIAFIDPADRIGSWHNNDSYLDVFTQSTRSTTAGFGGASGGFDDRFDFILTSENLKNASGTNTDLFYVEDSYQAYGNNSNLNCFNKSINSTDCEEDNDVNTKDFSALIREALYNFSDHLPVTIQFQTNQTFLSVTDLEYTTANFYEIIGTNIVSNTINLHINNQIFKPKKITIFNTLGQKVKTISVNNYETQNIDVSNLSNGLYYITTPDLNIEPLKFVKIN